MQLEILLVGAGAVGRVYGQHIAKGGARVSFFVREKHAAEVRAGVSVARVLSRTRREHARLVPHEVLTTIDEVAARRFDQVWLCLPTTALDEPWIDDLLGAIGAATLVALQPGVHVRERLARPTLVQGGISIIAWSSPLEGSSDPVERASPATTAYWLPPLQKTRFSSADAERARAVADALRRGGCPAGVTRDAAASLAFGSAVLMPAIASLEASGWSLRALRRDGGLARALAAARAMIVITEKTLRARGPMFAWLLRAPLLAPLVALAPRVVPFDLEPYLEHHFRKVGAQTRALLESAIEDGRAHDVDPAALVKLRGDLR